MKVLCLLLIAFLALSVDGAPQTPELKAKEVPADRYIHHGIHHDIISDHKWTGHSSITFLNPILIVGLPF